eukprot:213522-Pyramimonas_sp.AAC.1
MAARQYGLLRLQRRRHGIAIAQHPRQPIELDEKLQLAERKPRALRRSDKLRVPHVFERLLEVQKN